MRSIAVIAVNTFRECVRDKILYNIVFIALALAFGSILLGEWSVFDRTRVIESLTFSIMSLSGVLISIFVGIGLLQKEIQRRTVFALLAKPVRRSEFIIGKYLGLLGILATHLLLLTLVFFLILWGVGEAFSARLLLAVLLIWMELAIVLAAAVLFSSFSTPVLSSLFTFGLYLAGRLSDQILEQVEFVRKVNPDIGDYHSIMEWAARIANLILPGLYRFDISSQVIHGLPLPSFYLGWAAVHALGFVILFLTVACWWFSRRDFL